ncbi:Rne/Rng family ribonuclease [Aeromicrobium sp. CTD01-1L150]|uniref:Rne/Rng family ribonuclease n=1 Tax=Aeromicrobium sp. CTD01-1L150 TaxID=3341830 RepID=UPI0035BF7F27
MLDDDNNTPGSDPTTTSRSSRRRAAGRAAGPPAPISTDIFAAPSGAQARSATDEPADRGGSGGGKAQNSGKVESSEEAQAPEVKAPTARTTGVESVDSTASKKKAASRSRGKADPTTQSASETPAEPAPKKSTSAGKAKKADAGDDAREESAVAQEKDQGAQEDQPSKGDAPKRDASKPAGSKEAGSKRGALAVPTFQAPETTVLPPRPKNEDSKNEDSSSAEDDSGDGEADDTQGSGGGKRRRRSRGGRRRNKSDDATGETQSSGQDDSDDSDDDSADGSATTRRRRRRARAGEGAGRTADDPEDTVVKVREGRSAQDEITSVTGSTRLEAKKQRRREGREAGRRRAPIVSEAEFLARRESVERQMIVRQSPASVRGTDDNAYTQIAVMEDSVLVEHYVARESQVSIIGNVYLGKVQNVLPSMEAAFIDIGAGRNAVIYAGEVDWSGVQNGKARKIEEALQPGQTVLVQVTKDPIGQKGARLTSQISLPGRFLVYVPGGQSNGISRKLPDTERSRLKSLLKQILPEDAGVIVRTAAEGASEEQLTRDVTALKARWEDIEGKVDQATTSKGGAPQLLYAEPDLVIKVVRDLFNEDFSSLVVDGPDAWDNISGYIQHVAPDLAERLNEWRASEHDGQGAFEALRIEEQIHKALEHKVWLPSGGSLIIDRTEAMTVIDVNTGKFTGSGGNLEETVTKNNLEAAEEIVRQLRLRDIGGIIVIDFIDMVLESNRDLVLRRLVECLGRDRTRHQVAEVTSLGLVQMTRKRIGTGLLESFSTDCDHCKGRGVVITAEPVEPKKDDGSRRGGGRRRGGRGGNGHGNGSGGNGQHDGDTARGQDKGSGKDGGKGERSDGKPAEAKSAGHKDDDSQDAGPKNGGSKSAGPKSAGPKSQGSAAGAEADSAASALADSGGAQPVESGTGVGSAEQGTGEADATHRQTEQATSGARKPVRRASRKQAAPTSADPVTPSDVSTEKVDDQLGTSPVLTDTPEAP